MVALVPTHCPYPIHAFYRLKTLSRSAKEARGPTARSDQKTCKAQSRCADFRCSTGNTSATSIKSCASAAVGGLVDETRPEEKGECREGEEAKVLVLDAKICEASGMLNEALKRLEEARRILPGNAALQRKCEELRAKCGD